MSPCWPITNYDLPAAKRWRKLLVEVYNHGENCDLHRRIGEELGVKPGEDAHDFVDVVCMHA